MCLQSVYSKENKAIRFSAGSKTVEAIYKHRPPELLKASGLEREHQEERQAKAAFDDNWKIVEVWSEQSRYQIGKSEQEVADFYSALLGDEGVFIWLKKYW